MCKMKRIFWTGLMSAMMFAGCSTTDENPIPAGGTTNPADGASAYMNVRISDVSSGTRASAGTGDNEFEVSTNEHHVTNVDFYFYDGNGDFLTRANVWNGGNDVNDEGGNVEFNGNTVVVLKGVTDTTLPKYLVTVLNSPSSNLYGATLEQMEKLLSDATATDGGFMSGNDFIMTTSSFKRADASAPYFVTELDETNFVKDPGSIPSANVVTVYVERLAAKVRIEVTPEYEGAKNPLVPVAGQPDTYEMKLTVAGDPNKDPNGTTSEDKDHIGSESVYIHFLGWNLNGTAKKSMLIKNIDPSWADAKFDFGFDWSEAGRHRSYWGMSYNYGNLLGTYTYPTEEQPAVLDTHALNYVNSNERKAMDEAIYCAENTNTSEIVSANPAGTLTSALLFAEVTDKENNPLDLVRYSGLFYTKAQFVKYVFGNLDRKGSLEYYTESATEVSGEKKYTQIQAEDADIENLGGGYVHVQLTLDENTPLFTADGTPIEAKDGKTAVEQANEVLAGFDTTNGAIAYIGGLMYYNIPIEHYNNSAVVEKVVPEAKYGVVRNHVYVLNVTSLSNLGMGIYDPNEEIVPGDPIDPKELYQVGATIKILSWKVVNQNVEL